jgi:hypothetical protein
MKDTALYKELRDCDDSFEFDEKDLQTDDTVKSERTEIWLSQWQHEITSVNVRSEDREGAVTEVSWLPKFNGEVSVDIPKDARTLTELQSDIQAIFMEYMMSQLETEPQSPSKFGQSL